MLKKLCLSFLLFTGVVFASEQPIKIIMPFAAGGPGDVMARIVQKTVSEHTKRNIVIEYKLGAGGEIAAEYVANYRGSESIFLWTSSSFASNNVGQNPLYNIDNLKPVAFLGHVPLVLVSSKKFQYRSLKDWKDIPSAQPIFYASAGNYTSTHLNGEVLKEKTKKNLIHVPYKGVGQTIPDLLAGNIDVSFVPWNIALPYILTGNLIPIASISDQRLLALPDTPTFRELGYKNFGLRTWFMIVAGPTSKIEDAAIIQTALIQILSSAELSQPFVKAGLEYNINDINHADQVLSKELSVYQQLYKSNPSLIPQK